VIVRESIALPEYLDLERADIERGLDLFLPNPPDCPTVVCQAMRYSVMGGGKRFRPVLTLAAAEAVAHAINPGTGGAERARGLALPAACAIEFIHTYSLIHDDLPAMDDDALRRGRPTLHVAFGEGIAILAGDSLLAEAFALLAREPADETGDLISRKLRVIRKVGEAAGGTGMVGGQAIDLEGAAGRVTLDGPTLQSMHLKKTGALIRAAACAGAIIAGGTDAHVSAIDRFATELGLSFQIVDDILDVESTTAEMGKTTGKDAAAGKTTYPTLYGISRSRQMARESIDRGQRALVDAGLTYRRLPEIGEWVVSRTH
jgi:geranylgeranyl diphosphate synthase type II